MRYNIVYSAEARQDLRNIYQYGGRDIRKQLIEL